MKVILQQDVARLGKKYQEVEVPNGYALNKLIPSGQAVAATKEQQKLHATRVQQQHAESATTQAKLEAVVAALSETPLVVPMGANEQGQLFQAVSVASIVMAASERDVPLTADMVVLPEKPMKSLGEYKIEVTAAGATESVAISVVAASV